MNSALFISFNNLFNCAVKIFSTRTYSFNKNANYSFNEFIHSKKVKNNFFKENIHSIWRWRNGGGLTR